MLQDNVPTHSNLLRNWVIIDLSGMLCVFCENLVKSDSHLFVTRVSLLTMWGISL
ncbi:hypothetical protein MtrunA17_Chr1g0186881 [Medicago truncatula]|uniref:Uncharacterized protein n=1 Tax=Medicago truncatula TaxID=3880 RepID=A0A396JVF2_MEDTR|nr:hypothetical protein MtrunA17_Chr1g0186881 [Medicago truncatula]